MGYHRLEKFSFRVIRHIIKKFVLVRSKDVILKFFFLFSLITTMANKKQQKTPKTSLQGKKIK